MLIYHDRIGRRWQVYDRRSGERRQPNASPTPVDPSTDHRAFVNDAGEEWRCVMADDDFLDQSPATLEKQLARATRLA
jgi:hypothetical protein